MTPACGLCGNPKGIRFLFEKNGFKLFLCSYCDMGFIHPVPSSEELKKIYTLDYFKGNREKFGYTDYTADTQLQSRNFPERVRIIESLVPKGRILDVGCADGAFLQALGSNWEKHGIEVSSELIASCNPSSDINVFQGDALDFTDATKYDVATLYDVLDHVRNPDAVITKVASLLRPGGVIAVLQGDMSSLFAKILGKHWHVYIPPTHLWFFTRRGLSRLLERHGFEILRVDYEPHWASIGLCFFRLSYMFQSRLFKSIYEKLNGTAVGDLGIKFNFHDVMTVYARRK